MMKTAAHVLHDEFAFAGNKIKQLVKVVIMLSKVRLRHGDLFVPVRQVKVGIAKFEHKRISPFGSRLCFSVSSSVHDIITRFFPFVNTIFTRKRLNGSLSGRKRHAAGKCITPADARRKKYIVFKLLTNPEFYHTPNDDQLLLKEHK